MTYKVHLCQPETSPVHAFCRVDHPYVVCVEVAKPGNPTVNELAEWLMARGLQSEYVSTSWYEEQGIEALFSVTFCFDNPDDVILFKLTWGGR